MEDLKKCEVDRLEAYALGEGPSRPPGGSNADTARPPGNHPALPPGTPTPFYRMIGKCFTREML
jgi:hypothetical protein